MSSKKLVGGPTESLAVHFSLVVSMVMVGDTLNYRPPDQGNLTIGEIMIPIIQGELPVSTSMDCKPGQCFPKTSAIPSMLVKSANISEKI